MSDRVIKNKAIVTRRQVLKTLSGASVMMAMPQFAWASKTFPNRPLKIVVTTPPGGKNDLIARLVADRLGPILGQRVIVDNKPGANGIIAARDVAGSAPDGYTLLMTLSGFALNLVTNSATPYKVEDFIPLSNLAIMPVVYAVSSEYPVKTLAEWVELAKSKPGELSYGTIGLGSSMHLMGEGLNKAAGISVEHIAYKGTPLIIPDLASGRLASAFGGPDAYTSLLVKDQARLLAVASPTRISIMPDLPTFAELGYPKIGMPGWGGLLLPAGTPPDIVQTLSDAVLQVMSAPDVKKQIVDMGFEPLGNTSQAFSKQIQEEIAQWKQIMSDADIKL